MTICNRKACNKDAIHVNKGNGELYCHSCAIQINGSERKLFDLKTKTITTQTDTFGNTMASITFVSPLTKKQLTRLTKPQLLEYFGDKVKRGELMELLIGKEL